MMFNNLQQLQTGRKTRSTMIGHPTSGTWGLELGSSRRSRAPIKFSEYEVEKMLLLKKRNFFQQLMMVWVRKLLAAKLLYKCTMLSGSHRERGRLSDKKEPDGPPNT